MNKILVTTDFSNYSKAGIRFALQLASQSKVELTFIHCYFTAKPTIWTQQKFDDFEKDEVAKLYTQLDHFVMTEMKKSGIDIKLVNYACVRSRKTDEAIRLFAEEHQFNFICISTRGAGGLKKFLGTNTSELINTSMVPVIAVPYDYKPQAMKHIMYASDLANADQELKEVAKFVKPLKAKVEMLHFSYPSETETGSKVTEKAFKHFQKNEIEVHLEKINLADTLVANIIKAVKKSKPSAVIMFTQHKKSFFERLFMSSNTAGFSFQARVPLIVFNKVSK